MGEWLESRVGYRFPVLAHLHSGRARRTIACVLELNLNPARMENHVPTALKCLAGVVFAVRVQNAPLAQVPAPRLRCALACCPHLLVTPHGSAVSKAAVHTSVSLVSCVSGCAAVPGDVHIYCVQACCDATMPFRAGVHAARGVVRRAVGGGGRAARGRQPRPAGPRGRRDQGAI